MGRRFSIIMLMLAVLNAGILGAIAAWGHEAVKPWILPALWVFIAATYVLDLVWNRQHDREMDRRETEFQQKLAKVRGGPTEASE